MKRTFYTCLFFVILQCINYSTVSGQASVYSSKKGGIAISIDDTPDSDAKVAAWESYRLLFNTYNYKFNIALQSELLNLTSVSNEVKQMIKDGHEIMDHCPQYTVSEFYFEKHMEDSVLYVKNGIPKPGIASVTITPYQVRVVLKTNPLLDPTAIPVLMERTRLLYRRYLKDSTNYPRLLAQPGDGTSISHTDGYVYLKNAGYTSSSYDGLGKEDAITKTYNVSQSLYHPAFNMKRADWGNISDFAATTNWIANDIARHQVVSILFHYTDIDAAYLTATDKFLKWCRDNKIPLLTLTQWMKNLNDSIPDPTTNVFPDFAVDLDGNGKPDGYEDFSNVTINKVDALAPGGSSLTKSVGGNILEIKRLGAIEKGKNSLFFSAKGQINATVEVRLRNNITAVAYCDTTIVLNSATWKTYKASFVVPDNVILSDVLFFLQNIGSGNSVSVSNIQLFKGDKIPTVKLRDSTITIKQTILLSAQPGCSNYKWSTGETTQTIVFDGAKSGPGTFPVSYTADDPSGASLSDNCVIIVKGLVSSPVSFSLPAQSASGTLKITANILWNITSKKHLVTVNPASGSTSSDVILSMPDNTSLDAVDDTLTITSSQSPVSIPVHQAGVLPQLSVNKNLFSNISRNGSIESVQITANVKWKISGQPIWIALSPQSGNGNGTLAFKVDSNKLATQRTGSIIIKAPNGPRDSLSVTITLTQSGADYVELDRTSVLTSNIAKTETVRLTSSTDWTITHQTGWLGVAPSSGSKNAILSLVIQENTNADDRKDTITIKTKNSPNLLLVVTQSGTTPKVYLDKTTVTVSAAVNTISLVISSTTGWTITDVPVWARASQLSGTGSSTVQFVVDQNKLLTTRSFSSIKITPTNGTPVLFEIKQDASPAYVIPSVDHFAFGPANGDTVSIFVSSNIKWRMVNTISWLKTVPGSWVTIDGDKKISITLDTQYLSSIDVTGADILGTFTLEEDSSSPTRIIKTIAATLKSYPAVLSIPVHSYTFKGIASTTFSIVSNLPWSSEKRTVADWLVITPSSSTGNADVKLDCTVQNTSSKDNSVYLIISQTKGTLKDSILLIQSGTNVGISDYAHSGIKIYPQPAGELLNIDLPDNSDMKYWNIYNTIGVELLKGRIENKNKLQIPLSRLSRGLYFITLWSDSKKIGIKFTK